MLPVEEARARVLAGLRPVGAETVGLAAAAGRVLAADVVARLDQPPADVSAMDGYALRLADAGRELRVAGEAPAGRPFAGAVGAGEAVRVFTGSVVPAGADCVMLQEDAERQGDRVRFQGVPRPGQHIRRCGQDFRAGARVLEAGMRLGARAIGLAAAANQPWLTVHRRPRVAILCTGDEIVLPGEPVPPGGIAGSNGPMLAALVAEAGGKASLLPVVADRVDDLAAAVRAAAGFDLLVTTGGASVGDHDQVRAGLGEGGFALDFWRIAMRPGKPMLSGRIGDLPVLGLPGNPVSAFVCAVLFLLPALRALGGERETGPALRTVRLGATLPANDHRADYLRGRLRTGEGGEPVAVPFSRQDSAMLSVLAEADCLIVRPPHAPAAPEGEPVSIVALREGW